MGGRGATRQRVWLSVWGVASLVHAGAVSPHAAELAGAYDHHMIVLSGAYHLHWMVDHETTTLHLAMDVNTTGWVGFGIAQPVTSSMKLADMVTAHVNDEDGTVEVVDRYTEDSNAMPKEDCQQDWQVLSGRQTEGWTEVRLHRLLETGDDAQDRILDTEHAWKRQVRVLGAYGLSDTFSYHGPMQRIGFKADIFREAGPAAPTTNQEQLDQDASLFSVDLRQSAAKRVWVSKGRGGFVAEQLLLYQRETDEEDEEDVESKTICDESMPCVGGVHLPASEGTVYTEGCWAAETFLGNMTGPAAPWHVVGMAGVVMDTSEALVHHFVVTGFTDHDDCGGNFARMVGSVIFVWGPGGDAMMMPAEAGFPIVHAGSGDGYGFKSIGIQMHYTNDAGASGLVDDSAVRLYISHTPRTHTVGVLQLGDPLVKNRATLPSGLSTVEYNCPAHCTSTIVNAATGSADGAAALNVFGSVLHMHQNGVGMQTQQIRNGQVIDSLTGTGMGRKVESFSFDHQDSNPVEMTIMAGDSFNTQCYYDTSRSEKETVHFGLGSADEMCIDFLYYFPASPVFGYCGYGFCGSLQNQVRSVNASELAAFQDFPSACPSGPLLVTAEAPPPPSAAGAPRATAYALALTSGLLVLLGAF